MLTHGNLALAAHSNLYAYAIGPEDRAVLLSYLPLAHIYEVIDCVFLWLDTLTVLHTENQSASHDRPRRLYRLLLW